MINILVKNKDQEHSQRKIKGSHITIVNKTLLDNWHKTIYHYLNVDFYAFIPKIVNFALV